MTILCYHAVDPDWESPMAMTPRAFAEHAGWLARNRRVVDLPDAVDLLTRRGGLRGRAVALTFDDGFAGLHDHALPILRRLGLPATVFLVAETLTPGGRAVDWVDTPPRAPLATLARDRVLEMQESGIRFGSHSFAHLDLTALSEAACERDLRESREVLEDVLGRPVRLLAYPRGRHDERVRAVARRAGYTHAFTLPEGPEGIGPMAIPRVGVYRGNGLGTLRLKTSRTYVTLRTSPVWRALRSGGVRRA